MIIQEKNQCPDIPDDNQEGGVITFDFNPMAKFVYDIGLLDVDYPVSIVLVYKSNRGSTREKTLSVPLRGNNSLQKYVLNQKNVVQLRLNLRRSGAVTSLVSTPMFRCILPRMFLFFRLTLPYLL